MRQPLISILESLKKIRRGKKKVKIFELLLRYRMFIRSNQKGFTLGEVLASLIALGIIALTVQSLMLVANNFLSQQSSTMASMQERTFFSKLMCHQFQRPVFVEQNLRRSFTYTPGSSTTIGASYLKKDRTSTNPLPNPKTHRATLSVSLLQDSKNAGTTSTSLDVPDHSAVKDFLKDQLTAPTDPTDVDKILRIHINDKKPSTPPTNLPTGLPTAQTYYSQFYDIYSDDHTLLTFMVRGGSENSDFGQISEGFIYASRCMKNGEPLGDKGHFIQITGNTPTYSIIDYTDKPDMNPTEIKATALYVLEQKSRPFYFPEQPKAKDKVVCCDINHSNTDTTAISIGSPSALSIPGHCGNLETYTPIIYVIKFSSGSNNELADKIRTGGSWASYFLNNIDDSRTAKECTRGSPATDACKRAIKSSYTEDLGSRFVHAVEFESVAELPLVKKNRVNAWAYSFIAPSFGSQGMHKEFKIISVENKCHSSLPVGLCGKTVPGLDLTNTNHHVSGKSVAEYFIAQVSHCPFHYVTMESSAGTLPFGIDR